MKLAYTLSATVLAACLCGRSSAQLVVLTNSVGDVLNGTTIHVDSPVDTIMEMDIITTSGTSQLVDLKRYETDVQPGTQNYFCWYQCFLPANVGDHPLWLSSHPVQLDEAVPFNGAHAYYDPNGVVGISTFRFVWYNISNPDDSTWVDIQFNYNTTIGITENASTVRNFGVYPNPSTGGDITLNYDLTSAKAGTQLAVYNVLGERKLIRNLNSSQGKVTLPENELASGVWFAVLERNGKVLATKRVVVSK